MQPFRYERKFLLASTSRHEVEALVKQHPCMFREIFHERSIHNIYFDTLDMRSYVDARIGSHDKIKARVRWYGEMYGAVNRPVLEFKIKKGEMVRKVLYPLKSFFISGRLVPDFYNVVFKESGLPVPLLADLSALRPVVMVTYVRKYFAAAQNSFRITVDSDVAYYRFPVHAVHGGLSPAHNLKTSHVIVELKYSPEYDERAGYIMQFFPYRTAKYSKYAAAIASFS